MIGKFEILSVEHDYQYLFKIYILLSFLINFQDFTKSAKRITKTSKR